MLFLFASVFFLYIYIPSKISPSSPIPCSSSIQTPSSNLPPFLFKYTQASQGYRKWRYREVQWVIQCSSSSIKAGWCRMMSLEAKRNGFRKQATQSETAPAPIVRSLLQEDQVTQLQHVCRVPRSVPCRLSNCQFSVCYPLEGQGSWFCEVSCGALDITGSYNPFPPLPQDSPSPS